MFLEKDFEMHECFSHRMRKDIEDQEICMEKTHSDLWKKGIKLSSEVVPSGEL